MKIKLLYWKQRVVIFVPLMYSNIPSQYLLHKIIELFQVVGSP